MVSAIALTGSAAPALATPSHHSEAAVAPAAPAESVDTSVLSTAVSGARAAAAIEQTALDLSLQAQKESSVAAAKKAAATAKKAADAKAAAVAAAKAKAAKAAEAAKERAAAAQAASRSAQRAKLAVPTASASPSANSSSGSSGSSSSSSSSGTSADTADAAPSTATGSAAKLISFLKSQLGKPYVYGATGPDSYDCSGLTQVAYQTVGVSLPRTSQEQSTVGTPVSVSDVQPGDIIFWGGEGSAYHVGVYIGDGQYLDAANPSTPVAIHQMADYMPDWAVRVL